MATNPLLSPLTSLLDCVHWTMPMLFLHPLHRKYTQQLQINPSPVLKGPHTSETEPYLFGLFGRDGCYGISCAMGEAYFNRHILELTYQKYWLEVTTQRFKSI